MSTNSEVKKYNFTIELAKELSTLDPEQKKIRVSEECNLLEVSLKAGLGYSIEMSSNYPTANLLSLQFEPIRLLYNSRV